MLQKSMIFKKNTKKPALSNLAKTFLLFPIFLTVLVGIFYTAPLHAACDVCRLGYVCEQYSGCNCIKCVPDGKPCGGRLCPSDEKLNTITCECEKKCLTVQFCPEHQKFNDETCKCEDKCLPRYCVEGTQINYDTCTCESPGCTDSQYITKNAIGKLVCSNCPTQPGCVAKNATPDKMDGIKLCYVNRCDSSDTSGLYAYTLPCNYSPLTILPDTGVSGGEISKGDIATGEVSKGEISSGGIVKG